MYKMLKSSQFISIIIQNINMPLSLEIMWSNFDKQRPLTATYISNNGYV